MDLRDKIIGAIATGLSNERGGLDVRVAADAILAIPEIRDALEEKAEADKAVRGGGYYLRATKIWSDRIKDALANA